LLATKKLIVKIRKRTKNPTPIHILVDLEKDLAGFGLFSILGLGGLSLEGLSGFSVISRKLSISKSFDPEKSKVLKLSLNFQ
jgi:hypothetical protein